MLYKVLLVKTNKMKTKLLILLCLFGLVVSVGCPGSQDIVEPSRDSLNKGKVEYTTSD